MQRGEGMAPLTDAQRDAAERRWMGSSRDVIDQNNHNHDKRGTSPDSSSNVKNNRDAQSGPPGGNSKTPPDFGKGKFGGAGGGNFGKGFKSNGNSNNDDKNKDNNDGSNSNSKKGGNSGNNNKGGNSNNNNNDNNDGSKSSSSSNTNNAGTSNTNNDGNNNGNDSSNGNSSGNTNNAGSAATTTAAISGDDGSSDSNGAEQFSSDSIDGTTTSTDTPTAAAPTTTTPPAVVLTTSTIVTTGPDAIVTSFVPLITTAATGDSTTTLHKPFPPFGPFGTNFPGFPTFSRPTGKNSSDDKKHKGVNGTTTDDDNNNNNNNSGNGNSSNNNKGNNNNNNNNNKGSSNNNSSKSLDPTAERALISVGSIGAFIVICFIFWLVWRAFKKQKQKKLQRGNISTFPSHDGPFTTLSRLPGRIYDRVVNKIPFASRQRKAWQTLEETSSSNAGPIMASNVAPSKITRAVAPAYQEKGGDTLRTFGFESDLPPTLPSQVYYSGGLGLGLQFQSPPQQPEVSNANRMPTGPIRSNSNVSAFTHSPAASFSSSIVSAQSAMSAAVPYGANNGAVSVGQPTGPVMVINEAGQQYLTDDIGSAASTMRSRMPDPFYNQSQLARQPSDAYDPARRQVNRASELSSLSSGFGDGEILMLASDQQQTQAGQMPMTAPRPPRIPSGPPPAASAGAAGRFSWMRKHRMSRETVYTESSDDQPAKFRSVNSWVNQQTGRVRRGQASIDTTTSASVSGVAGGDVAVVIGNEPGIPHPMPEEQRLTMMMDDGEVPRRPDTVPGIQMA